MVIKYYNNIKPQLIFHIRFFYEENLLGKCVHSIGVWLTVFL